MDHHAAPLKLCYVGPADSVTTRRWAGWFAARGHAVTIVTVEPSAEPLSAGMGQIDLRSACKPRKLGRLVSASRLGPTLRRLAPDLVHVHYAKGLAWGLLAASSRPLVVTPWGSDVLEEQGAFREGYSKHLTAAVLNRAALVTVHSAYMEAHVRPLLKPSVPVARIGWGVDLRRFRLGLDVSALRTRWNIADHRQVVFSPRLARPFYRLDAIIRAFPVVHRRCPNALLVLSEQAADEAYVAGLKDLVSQLGLHEHVRFVGAIPYHEMPYWLNLADVSVMMPESDGMPNSLWEAMACGAVPVLRGLPQYREVIRHEENGLFADDGPEALGQAIAALLEDRAQRARMAHRNQELARERADQDREMSRMEAWYRTLAGSAERSAATG